MHTRQTVFEFEPKKGSFVMDTYSTLLRAFRGPVLAHVHQTHNDISKYGKLSFEPKAKCACEVEATYKIITSTVSSSIQLLFKFPLLHTPES